MPDQPFTVHLDQDDLAKLDLAAALKDTPFADAQPDDSQRSAESKHHGIRDGRDAAPSHAKRTRPTRASDRSYAFRRS